MDIEAAKKQEPMAWAVFCEKGEENDYTVFWYEEDAKEHAERTEEAFDLEEGSKEIIPLYPDLPDAIELIERMEELLRVVSMQSDHVDCDGPGCWWCGAESGTSHAKACAVEAVLVEVGSLKKTP